MNRLEVGKCYRLKSLDGNREGVIYVKTKTIAYQLCFGYDREIKVMITEQNLIDASNRATEISKEEYKTTINLYT